MSVDVDKAIAELKTKVDGMPGGENKLTMIVMSGGLDKHLAAMIIATGAAAMGMQVVLFYTFWGLPALRAPKKKVGGKNLIEKMFGMMLPKGKNKLNLSKMNMAGIGPVMIQSLMKKQGVLSLDQMFKEAAELGIEITICEMSMNLMGFKKEEMIDYPDLRYAGAATFVADANESSIHLFI